MKPDLPFDVAKDQMLYTKLICWTNEPDNLSRRLQMPFETIEETQKGLLYQSLINSVPVKTNFLKEYDLEMKKTAGYLRDRNKNPILIEEMKDGF
jgi:hypothetical protein